MKTLTSIDMKNTSEIAFEAQGKHSFQSGIASVAPNYNAGKNRAVDFFAEAGDSREVKLNKLLVKDGYSIYECFTDSGSEDYYYFAVSND